MKVGEEEMYLDELKMVRKYKKMLEVSEKEIEIGIEEVEKFTKLAECREEDRLRKERGRVVL